MRMIKTLSMATLMVGAASIAMAQGTASPASPQTQPYQSSPSGSMSGQSGGTGMQQGSGSVSTPRDADTRRGAPSGATSQSDAYSGQVSGPHDPKPQAEPRTQRRGVPSWAGAPAMERPPQRAV